MYETLVLAEKGVINTINIGFSSNEFLAKYKKSFGSKIQVILQVAPNMKKDDYYMKIMHHDRYWSDYPCENRIPFAVNRKRYSNQNRLHDNVFYLFSKRTVDFVRRTNVPVMGFKILDARAIKPDDVFRWAFENGTDFICVDMFDFQIVEDANICMDTIANLSNRNRK